MSARSTKWYHELTSYHWFVLAVAALGWLFDCLDQHLFNLARRPAMIELLAPSPGTAPSAEAVDFYGPLATSIFLIGWGTGGLAFGVLGDRIGRAKTMLLTILLYSLFTGLSAMSVGFWDFAFYRFLTGLGVGGEFAVGVALVAEVMPNTARPYALGLLQALSAVGNASAALINIGLGIAAANGAFEKWVVAGHKVQAWRLMFLIGILPALLAVLIRRRLKEPERWEAVAADAEKEQRAGSFRELFGDP
ncbi:MAG TPA: MFS transporter, partial [Pirellulales bacterium]|nr:MFS transporter [Pirellulales bacterium]